MGGASGGHRMLGCAGAVHQLQDGTAFGTQRSRGCGASRSGRSFPCEPCVRAAGRRSILRASTRASGRQNQGGARAVAKEWDVRIPARSREEGCARLIGIIDRAASRLREMLGEHSKRVDREAEKAVLEEEYDRSPEGQRLNRQEMDYLRQLKRAIATDRGFRRESAAWNETRRPENETR